MKVSSKIHAPPVFISRETNPGTHCTRDLVGPQSQSGRYGEEKNMLLLPKIEPRFHGRSACSLVSILYELASKYEYSNIHNTLKRKTAHSFVVYCTT
jgi:hypothetical protein